MSYFDYSVTFEPIFTDKKIKQPLKHEIASGWT